MKPLQLWFSGLRSYVSEQHLDFRGHHLVGVTGDTGAGKSSILMAINFALYGTTTWESTSSKPLIADGGAGILKVTLEFEIRGRQWRVTRKLSRKPTGNEHKLEALDGAETVHGRAVTPRVAQLIGMDNKTFLRSVLLPQGKFEQLLHASNSERAGILKGLLGLDILDTVADTARRHRDALMPAYLDLRARKEALGDPRAAAAAAASQAEAIGTQLDELTRAQEAVAALSLRETTAAREHADLAKLQTALAAAGRTDAAQRLRELAQLDADITNREQDLDTQAEPLQGRRDELVTELGELRPGGSKAGQLTSAIGQLPQLRERLNNQAQRRERHETDVETVRALQAEVAAATAEETRHTPLLANAESVLTNHNRTVGDLTKSLEGLQTALSAVRDIADHAQQLSKAKPDLDGAVSAAAATMAKARDAKATLERELAAAEAELQWQQRANAAAHAGEGLEPGAACPVCQHPVPDEYAPPHAPDLTAAQGTVASAREKLSEANQKVTDAVAAHREAQTLALQADDNLTSQNTRLQTAIDELATKIGAFSLDADDKAILAPQHDAVHKMSAETPALTEAVEKLRASKAEVTARAKTIGKQIDKQVAALRRDQHELEKLEAAIDELVAQIPDQHRPQQLTIDAVDARHRAAVLEQKDLAERWRVLADLDRGLGQIATQRRSLAARRTEQVTRPAAIATQAALTLRTAQSAIAAKLALPETPDIDLAADINTHARWAAQVAEDAQNTTSAAGQQLLQFEHTRRGCAQESAAIIAKAPTNGKPLDEAVSDAIGGKAVADSAHRDANAKTVEHDALADRLKTVQPHMDGLSALVKLLSDGQFVAGVVNERQQTLLGTATGLLRDMSVGQFAFGPDFQIWDEHTCRLRDVKTLSGGETFQASLALALALVEHASSSGGRAEALFLDEGFGTLDQTSLAEALDALSTQASTGRLVVVISHMLAVAQHVTSLIRVNKTPTGSSLRWATDAELNLLADAVDAEGLHT
ncbi:AAA family ATPase [Actinoplanes sp. NPDC048988]|uniref:AAA family ATPase n=1 Tax=Actinoplanes sp. NPDC048988 TaxID=3363901 RepID=UPI00371DA68F